MICGCDRIIVLGLSKDSQFLSGDGNLYLDLHKDTTFDQIDSITELDPLGNFKTEAVLGGSLPATSKNRSILGPPINRKDQKAILLDVVAMNGHKALNVNKLRVSYSDEQSYEIELLRDDTHWAVCASKLKLNTLDLEEYEFGKEVIEESWDNYAYEEGDLGVYFPLAYYGQTHRDDVWVVEDFRPAHSMKMLLTKGFCQCGWDFSSPIFDEIGKQLWIYALDKDYGKEPSVLEANKLVIKGENEAITIIGTNGFGNFNSFRSRFAGLAKYSFELDMQELSTLIGPGKHTTRVHLRVYRQYPKDGDTVNSLIDEITVPFPEFPTGVPLNNLPYFTVIEWEKEILTIGQDAIVITLSYDDQNIPNRPLSDNPAYPRYTYTVDPIRKTYQRGDTVTIADIIDKELSLLDLLKGTAHLFGQAKLYLNHATKEIKMFPPTTTKWGDQVIEGFFKYDEVVNLEDGLICDSLTVMSADFTASKDNIISYARSNNPYIEEDYQVRKVNFDNDFKEKGDRFENPVFKQTINKKLLKTAGPRPPISFDGASDGIDLMWLTTTKSLEQSYNIGVVPFLAYGNYSSYNEKVGDTYLNYSFRFEGEWKNIPVSGQKAEGYYIEDGQYIQPKPYLVYGEYPLEDLFSIFWREYFYKQALADTVAINVAFNSQQMASLDYRKLYYVQYGEGFSAWLSQREFNFCKPSGTTLTLTPDLAIEPECVDPDTDPPIVPPCDKTNNPQIEWEVDGDCMLTYSQVGTIESNIVSDEWLIRYVNESTFSAAPPSPFIPDDNLYLRYKAITDDEDCDIPVVTVFIDVCKTNVLEAEVGYNEGTDCYRIDSLLKGCNTYSDMVFEYRAVDDDMYEELTVSNPLDPVEDWYVEICEPEESFCIKITGTIIEGCEVEPSEVCINLCPTEGDIICNFVEVEEGFQFAPDLNIYKTITSTKYEYDLDATFDNPTIFNAGDTLTQVGLIYFRITLEITGCPTIIKTCSYDRNSDDCSLNDADFECYIRNDGRLSFIRTGNLVTETLLDIIRYKAIEQQEWQTWDGEPLDNCPVYAQRLVIFCNDCGNICTERKLCDCDTTRTPAPGDCDEFNVILNRYGGTLYAITPFASADILYTFYKDGIEVQSSGENFLELIGDSGNYRVSAVTEFCEAQDNFFYGEECTPPELVYISEENTGMDYDFEFTLNNPTDTPTVVVTNKYQETESETSTENYSVSITGTTLEFSGELHYGRNTIHVKVTTECGVDEFEFDVDIDCPEVDPGISRYITICQGCWGTLPLIDFLSGTPDSGGSWHDINASGKLSGGEVAFDELTVGNYEFMYVIDTGSQLCNQTASLFVEVLKEKSSGQNTSRNLCHDAGQTDLLSLISGNPEAGGEWYTDDVIDGTIDLVNGTITPAATDIGKTITIAYSHNQPTTELPSGLPPLECWLEFDGVDDYVQAADSSVFNSFQLPIEITIRPENSVFDLINKVNIAVSQNDWNINSVSGTFGFYSKLPNTNGEDYRFTNSFTMGADYEYKAFMDGSDFVQTLNGVEMDRQTSPQFGTGVNPYKFTVGKADQSNLADRFFEGRVYSFKFGTETFPMNEGTGTTITGSEGTVLDIYGATWNCEGVPECNCSTFAILQITIEDCTPPIPCPDDSGLGIDITESTNGSPADAQWEDLLTITKTGTYDDAGVVATDENYFSNDDGVTWIQGSEVKDDGYYVKLSSSFRSNCQFQAGTGYHEVYNVQLSNGEDADEATLVSRNGNFNNSWLGIDSSDRLQAAGSGSSLIAERFFRWDVKHTLNSGWQLALLHTIFDRGNSGNTCPNGSGTYGIHTYSGHRSGKRKILVQRRITYNNGCDPVTLEDEFTPTLPDCDPVPSNVGFNVTDPYKIGGSEYLGSVSCKGSMSGSTSDTMYVYEQPTGANGFSKSQFSCGGSDYLSFNYSYFFVRIINFTDCPPVILTRNYGAPTSCPTAGISCQKDNGNSRAKASRSGTPSTTSSDYLQRKIGSGNWVNYTADTWVYTNGQQTVSFRRITNYNNGCPQTTSTCSVTVSPPNWSFSISCSGNSITSSYSNLPGSQVAFFLYRDGVLVGSNQTGNFSLSQNGSYRVKYKYNQVQYIWSNTVNCGSGGGGCDDPVVALGACNVINGDHLKVEFITTDITNISQLQGSINPSTNGFMTFNSSTGKGTLEVDPAVPGQSYQLGITATNDCGTDSDSTTCQVGCSTLSADQKPCDYGNNRVDYDIIVNPDTGTIPTSNGTYLSKPSSGVYRFRLNQTSGTITASHPAGCNTINQAVNCQCPTPILNFNISCDNTQLNYSFSITNESSVQGDYKIKVDSNTYTIPNTGAGTYTGSITKSGLSHTYDFYYTACGSTEHETGNLSCSCQDPSINLTASCSGTSVSYSFTVTNENQTTGNYSLFVNGSQETTITNTGSGTYTGTITVGSGSNNTIQIKVNSKCGGQKVSNISTANCACPASTLSISGVSCDPDTQMLTFTVNSSNATDIVIKVNGSTVSGSPAQGVSGNNTITVTGKDGCSAASLSDSVTYNCGCNQPSIAASASCANTGVVSYSFTVTDESRVQGNYTILINGTSVGTKTNTGSGTYTGTYNGTPGQSYTVRIKANNKCGGETLSNNVGTSCGCPSSSLTIDSVSCNSSTQTITFTVNGSNITNRVVKVNNNTVPITLGTPKTIQGQLGGNSITATAEDSCTGNTLSASKNVNCSCNNPPTVSLGSPTESGGNITVPITTTNITSSSQIIFTANNSTQPVTGSGNSYSVTFPAQSGTKPFSVSVSNSCGTANDSGTYTYSPCVAPTITKINQGVTNGNIFYVQFSTGNCLSITSNAENGLDCASTFGFWAISGSTPINWSITVNGCDSKSATISGTYNPCEDCGVTIQNLGCSGTPEDVDFLLLVDHSTSVSGASPYTPCGGGPEFAAMQSSIRKTIENINSNGAGSYRYAVAEFSKDNPDTLGLDYATALRGGNRFNSYSDAHSDVSSWQRLGCACARWGQMYNSVSADLNSGVLNRRSGARLHILIYHDSNSISGDPQDCSPTGFLAERNSLLNSYSKVDISVVRYKDGASQTEYNKMSAAHATPGGTWGNSECVSNGNVPCPSNLNNCIRCNGGDPYNNVLPRRMYYRPNFGSGAVPNLVDDILQTCQLKANTSCSGVSYSWSVVSGGGSIIKNTGSIITTNGQGKYEVEITDSNGCTYTSTFDYSLQYTKVVSHKPVEAKPVEHDLLNFKYDYSGLTDDDKQKLAALYKEQDWKEVQKFYNKKVKSDYFFSCGCDNEKLEILVKKYLHGLGLL